MTSKITIKEIAKHADVGTTTESRVLNDHPYVSDEKRRRVEQATRRRRRGICPSGCWVSLDYRLRSISQDRRNAEAAVNVFRGGRSAMGQCQPKGFDCGQYFENWVKRVPHRCWTSRTERPIRGRYRRSPRLHGMGAPDVVRFLGA